MIDCLTIMMRDVGAAMGAAIHDRAPDGKIYESYVDYIDCAHAESGKPAALVAARQGTGLDPLVVDTSHRGLPVLDGVKPFLKGVRGLMDYRDFKSLPPMDLPSISSKVIKKWRQLLLEQDQLGEAQSLQMLRDFGVPASDSRLADSSDALQACAKDLGFPVVIKTAMADIAHKSEHAGVVLNIADSESLIAAYQDLDKRLGPDVVIAAMAPPGIEMILGSRLDPQFGPVVILGFGGILAEVLKDVVFALPPFDAAYANRRLSELKLRPILEGVRRKLSFVESDSGSTFKKYAAGLAAGVWSSDLNRAHRLIKEIEAGVIWVNSFDEGDMTQPFGGHKQSGNARDKCIDSLLSYTQSKSAWLRLY